MGNKAIFNKQLGKRITTSGTMDVINYNFDSLMYPNNVREEHVVSYREAVKASRDLLDGIAIVTQGRLPRSLISDNQLRDCLLYTSPSPRDATLSRMPSSA